MEGTTPYISLGLGYNVSTNVSSTDTSVDIGSTSGGIHYSAAVGLLIAETLQIELSYSHTEGSYESRLTSADDYTEYKFKHERVTVAAYLFF
jgi:hypothetical protein